MPSEDQIGWDYFGGDPENSPKMQEHMDWHMAPENQNRTGNYGERFLVFHFQFIEKFDVYRRTLNLLPVTGWDPATQIPAYLAHDHTLMAARNTDFPFQVAPGCKTPTWTTVGGGTETAPIYGYTHLNQFQSLDELGRAIDSGWHGLVHNTIGGDMASFHSPIDPVFWRWHRWIDNVRAAWIALSQHSNFGQVASLLRILFGGVNDGTGIGLGPDGRIIHIPGNNPEAFAPTLAPEARDILLSLTMSEIAKSVSHEETRLHIQQTATRLLKAQAQKLTQ